MGPASVALEEARQMTGTMHVADDQGDTTHTWDTADPSTVREIEELFREAQATGLTAAVVLGPCLAIQIRCAWAALVRRRQARRRAEALLWAWLSPAQRKQYRARRWFEVTTASGRRYRILRGGVVRLHPRGSGFCIEATSPVPLADEMLANKLLLETDERRFLATAHRFPYR